MLHCHARARLAWAMTALARRRLHLRPGRQNLHLHRHRLLSHQVLKARLQSLALPHGTASPGADATRTASAAGATSLWHAWSVCNTTEIAQKARAPVNGTTRVPHASLVHLRLPVLHQAPPPPRSLHDPRPPRVRQPRHRCYLPPCRVRLPRLPLHTSVDMMEQRSGKASASGTMASHRNAKLTLSSFGPMAASN